MPQEYVVRWTGGRIGQGASVFHFKSIAGGSAAQTIANAVRAMFNSQASSLSADLSFEFDPEVRELANDGTLTAVYPVTTPLPVVGSNAGSFVNGSGLMVRHSTGLIVNGRRLLGRTFIVPALSAQFDTNGDVATTARTSWDSVFATMRTAVAGPGANFAVWSRANGIVGDVVSSATQARPTTLRTRNDRL